MHFGCLLNSPSLWAHYAATVFHVLCFPLHSFVLCQDTDVYVGSSFIFSCYSFPSSLMICLWHPFSQQYSFKISTSWFWVICKYRSPDGHLAATSRKLGRHEMDGSYYQNKKLASCSPDSYLFSHWLLISFGFGPVFQNKQSLAINVAFTSDTEVSNMLDSSVLPEN